MKKQDSKAGMWLVIVAVLLIVFAAFIILSSVGCTGLQEGDAFAMTGKVESVVYQSLNGEQSITFKFEERFGKYHFIVDEMFDMSTLKQLKSADVVVKYRVPQSHIGSVKWLLVEVKVL